MCCSPMERDCYSRINIVWRAFEGRDTRRLWAEKDPSLSMPSHGADYGAIVERVGSQGSGWSLERTTPTFRDENIRLNRDTGSLVLEVSGQ